MKQSLGYSCANPTRHFGMLFNHVLADIKNLNENIKLTKFKDIILLFLCLRQKSQAQDNS